MLILILWIYIFTIGTIFGSFWSVLIERWHSGKSGIIAWKSECPKCQHKLSWYELIPIFSYLFLKWKCKNCHMIIHWSYPVLEFTMWMLFFMTYISVWVSYGWEIWGNFILQLCFDLLLIFIVVIFSIYDIRYMEIPDQLMITTILFLFIFLGIDAFMQVSWIASISSILYEHFQDFSAGSVWNLPLFNAMLWGIWLFLFFYLQILISNGKWMGWWDLRIALFLWFTLGAIKTLIATMLAYCIGSIIGLLILLKVRRKNIAIPFWPFLAIWWLLTFLFYEDILILYNLLIL